jgi:hypothetical protein
LHGQMPKSTNLGIFNGHPSLEILAFNKTEPILGNALLLKL